MCELHCDNSHYQGKCFIFTSAFEKGFTNPIRCTIYPHKPVVGTTFTIKGKTTENFESFSVNLTLNRAEDLDDCEIHYNPRLRTWRWPRRVVVLNHRVNKKWGPGERQDSVFTEDFTFELVMEVMPGGYSFKVNGGLPSFYKRTRENSDRNKEKFLMIKGDCYIYSIQIENLLCTNMSQHKLQRQTSNIGYSPPPYPAENSPPAYPKTSYKTRVDSQVNGEESEEKKIAVVRPSLQSQYSGNST